MWKRKKKTNNFLFCGRIFSIFFDASSMYLFLKKIILFILPKKILFKAETDLRKWYAYFLKGDKVKCVVCSGTFKRFINIRTTEFMCPACGSISRDRRLFSLLHEERYLEGKFLDFSPSRSLYRKFKTIKTIEYCSSDFSTEFLADYSFNITAINQPSEKFDVVLCYHVLEHVQDDQKAITEIYRVLKQGGLAFIQSPFKEGEIYENPDICTPEERKKHFGQEDHVRIYSIEGLKQRLELSGFNVSVLHFNKDGDNIYGFNKNEKILKCKK